MLTKFHRLLIGCCFFSVILLFLLTTGSKAEYHPQCTRVTAESLGGYILALQWPISFCQLKGECSLKKPRHDWIIHGLWPQNRPTQQQEEKELLGDERDSGYDDDGVQRSIRRRRMVDEDEFPRHYVEEEDDDEFRLSFQDFDEIESGYESDDEAEAEEEEESKRHRQNRRKRRRRPKKNKFLQFCCHPSPGFDADKVESLSKQLNDIWPSLKRAPDQTEANLNFWTHEWTKHGTCARELSSNKPVPIGEYFQKVLDLYAKFPIQKWLNDGGIVPSNDQHHNLDKVIQSLEQGSGLGPEFHKMFQIKCSNRKGGPKLLNEIRICLDRQFGPVSCEQLFGSGRRGNCNAEKILLPES